MADSHRDRLRCTRARTARIVITFAIAAAHAEDEERAPCSSRGRLPDAVPCTLRLFGISCARERIGDQRSAWERAVAQSTARAARSGKQSCPARKRSAAADRAGGSWRLCARRERAEGRGNGRACGRGVREAVAAAAHRVRVRSSSSRRLGAKVVGDEAVP